MANSIITPNLRPQVAALLFLAAIFIGDVWLVKLTLPLGVMILPVLFINRWRHITLPLASYILICLLLLVPLQLALGRSINWRSDLAIWAPVAFALLTIVCLSGREIPENRIKATLGIGGLISGGVMLAMICFASAGTFLVPGQNSFATGEKFKERVVAESSASGREVVAPEPQVVDRPMSEDTRAFYSLKNKAKTFLGGSNYIAVFFVFLFAVMLFSGAHVVAAVMAALVCATLSRIAIGFLGVIALMYLLHSRGVRAVSLCVFVAVLGVAAYAAMFLARDYVQELPGATSLIVRIDLLESAFRTIEAHPLLGAQRSLILKEQNFNIVWNPHNSIAWILANFGAVGLILYTAYLAVAVRTIAAAASGSALWTGVLVGMTALLIWSLSEIIVLTPAFELLLASMYALAPRADVSRQERLLVGSS